MGNGQDELIVRKIEELPKLKPQKMFYLQLARLLTPFARLTLQESYITTNEFMKSISSVPDKLKEILTWIEF